MPQGSNWIWRKKNHALIIEDTGPPTFTTWGSQSTSRRIRGHNLKRIEKHSRGNSYETNDVICNHKRCNIWGKRRGGQKEHTTQVMMLQLHMFAYCCHAVHDCSQQYEMGDRERKGERKTMVCFLCLMTSSIFVVYLI